MNALYMVVHKCRVGYLKGRDDTFALSVLDKKEDKVLVKVTNGLESNMFQADGVATMDFLILKDKENGNTPKRSQFFLGFWLP